jgi:hypothetical protein
MLIARRAVLAFAPLAVALLAAGCGPTPIPPAEQYALVGGFVRDGATGAPVPGALVTINFVLAATAGVDGHYAITNIPNGPWSFSASAPNYQSVSSTNPLPLSPGEKRLNFDIMLVHN